jgi:hypothetical protein
MKAYNLSVRNKENLSEYGIFKNLHVPLLVFQANTLRHIRRRYHITKLDFIVLAAGSIIQEKNLNQFFDSSQIGRTVVGISHNVLYKSLTRLLEQKLIVQVCHRKSQRRFILTEKGKASIQSFLQYYNGSIRSFEACQEDKRFRPGGYSCK